jgi:hypothetical protein|tara:strand:+ start:492 stop:725 length:234 start_codon:yes stop_codon:yes gene_type:complete
MIIDKFTGDKLTPNQMAKELLLDKMEQALEFWEESSMVEVSEMTDKERYAISAQLKKRYKGIATYLGFVAIIVPPTE